MVTHWIAAEPVCGRRGARVFGCDSRRAPRGGDSGSTSAPRTERRPARRGGRPAAGPVGARRYPADLHQAVRCRDCQGSHGASAGPDGFNAMTWTIERTLSARDLDEIVAIEHASFSNPWTRDMYVRELQNPDVSFLY